MPALRVFGSLAHHIYTCVKGESPADGLVRTTAKILLSQGCDSYSVIIISLWAACDFNITLELSDPPSDARGFFIHFTCWFYANSD